MNFSCGACRISAALTFLALATLAPAQTVTTLHSFSGGDGNSPNTALVQGPDGTLYGGTLYGGTENYGVLYSLQINGNGFDAFYSLCPNGGGTCQSGGGVSNVMLAQTDGAYKLYGNTQETAFYATPDGSFNLAGDTQNGTTPILATDGNLYVASGSGAEIYRWPLSTNTLVSICQASEFNLQGIVQGVDGNLYGTGFGGGTGSNQGDNTIFKCTLAGSVSVLYDFPSTLYPSGNLTVGPDGQLYGFAADNSGNTAGQFFKVNTSNGAYTTLLTISNSVGIKNLGTPALASDGNFYFIAGTPTDVSKFERITPSGTLTNVTSLTASGSFNNPPLQGSDGAFYVTAQTGGTNSDGAVVRIVPATPLPAPITMSLSRTSIVQGNTATLSWSVSGAYGGSATQCFATSTDSEWAGSKAISGSMTLTPAAVGQFSYALTCGGNISNSVSLTVTSNGKVNTSTSLSVSPNPVTIDSTATLTATVTPQTGTTTPTGSVTFFADGMKLTTIALKGGVASVSAPTTGYKAGTYTVTAEYTGSSAFNASTSSADSVVLTAQQPTTVTVTATPASVVEGGSVTISANVHAAGTATATGTVTFTAAGETLASGIALNSSGIATISGTASNIPEGTYTVNAAYSGSSTLRASSGTANISVAWPTGTSVNASPNPVAQGGNITLVANVVRRGNSGTPTGQVTFYADGQTVGTAALSGGTAILTAQLPTNTAQGTYSVTATYNGDTLDGASTSSAISVTVN